MCSPEAWAGATAGFLQSGAQNSAARTEWHWRKKMESMGEKSALEAMRTQYEQSATRQMQDQMSRGQEIAMIAKKAAAVKAAATVRASKGGIAGASVNALQQQFERDALESMGVRKQEAEWADSMAAQQREAIQQQAQSRIESVQAGPEPSSAGRFMNTLTSMVTGAIQGHQMSSGIEAADPSAAAAASGSGGSRGFFGGRVPQNWLQAPLENLYNAAIPPAYGAISRLGTTTPFAPANLGVQTLTVGNTPTTALGANPPVREMIGPPVVSNPLGTIQRPFHTFGAPNTIGPMYTPPAPMHSFGEPIPNPFDIQGPQVAPIESKFNFGMTSSKFPLQERRNFMSDSMLNAYDSLTINPRLRSDRRVSGTLVGFSPTYGAINPYNIRNYQLFSPWGSLTIGGNY